MRVRVGIVAWFLPNLDRRTGLPDIHVPPSTWIEVKAVHNPQSLAFWGRARGRVVTGSPGDGTSDRSGAFEASFTKAASQIARAGPAARGAVYFNFTTVGPEDMMVGLG
jgi:hypothetical protein